MEDNEKKILINVEDDETRIAVVDNATLDNLYIEQTHRTQILGNIFFGKVVKIQPSFQAAFVDYGADRHGFLAISDINSQLFKPNRATRGRPSINQLLKTGQQIMVQVIKMKSDTKAPLSVQILVYPAGSLSSCLTVKGEGFPVKLRMKNSVPASSIC